MQRGRGGIISSSSTRQVSNNEVEDNFDIIFKPAVEIIQTVRPNKDDCLDTKIDAKGDGNHKYDIPATKNDEIEAITDAIHQINIDTAEDGVANAKGVNELVHGWLDNNNFISPTPPQIQLTDHQRLFIKKRGEKVTYTLQQPVKCGYPVVIAQPRYSKAKNVFNRKFGTMDIVVVKEMFDNERMWPALNDEFEKLKSSSNKTSLFNENRHNGAHNIMDQDTLERLKETELYKNIKRRMTRYFHNMSVTDHGQRLNIYKISEGKPHHQDAPATVENRASYRNHNITIAASFGRQSSIIEFRNIFTGLSYQFEIEAGDVYAFGEAINLSFTHAVITPNKANIQTSPKNAESNLEEQRLSIVLWGAVGEKDLNRNSGWEFPNEVELERMKKQAA